MTQANPSCLQITARVSPISHPICHTADPQINKLSYGLDPNFVEPAQITMKVVQGCHNNVTTVELDVSPSPFP